jgi:hypothetical protein
MTKKTANLWKYSGIFLLATGILHSISAVLLFGEGLQAIICGGLLDAVGDDDARGLAFWFLICGITLIFLGQVLHYYIKREQKPAPLFLGYYMLALTVVGCIVVPVSGFWLFLPQALIIIFAKRK